jgi:YHS domain-containing protein
MLRLALLLVLFIVIARSFWRVVDNIVAAASGQPPASGATPQRGVAMARDPVCGTFVVRERALSIGDGTGRVFFCSSECRDKYQAGTRPAGRTA